MFGGKYRSSLLSSSIFNQPRTQARTRHKAHTTKSKSTLSTTTMKSAADRRRKCRPLAMTMSESQFVISTPITTSTIQSNLIYDQWQWHPAVRFTISGILGNAVFWGLDRMLFPLIVRTTTASVRLKRTVASMPNNKFVLIGGGVSTWINNNAASVSFFVAYLLDIAIQREFNSTTHI